MTDDGKIDDLDVSLIEDHFGLQAGQAGYREGLDLVPDGIIDNADISGILAHFGATNVATTPTALRGTVFDGLGNRLEGVKVLVGTVMGVTDRNGAYNLIIPPGETGETVITFDGSLAIDPTPGSGNGVYPTIPNKPIFINGGIVNVFRDISLPERDAPGKGQEEQELLPSDGLGDRFGEAVDISGNLAVVGDSRYDPFGIARGGAAYVYEGTPGANGTQWTQQQRLIASDVSQTLEFGQAVAIDGDTIVVGADQNTSGPGAAYVFVYNGTVWSEQQKLVASAATGGSTGDFFGTSVAISGGTILVGATLEDGISQNSGAVYVFDFDGSTWNEVQKLVGLGISNSNYGRSVSISGDRAIVGTREPVAGGTGTAHVLLRSGGIWSRQDLLFPNVSGDTLFGSTVAIDGGTALVGASGNDEVANNAGTAYVFEFDATSGDWEETVRLRASDGAVGDQFGSSVSLSGASAAIGAPFDALGGSAYVFSRAGSVWTEQGCFQASDGASSDSLAFGGAAAIDAGAIVAGAFGHDHEGLSTGSAYVFDASLLLTPP